MHNTKISVLILAAGKGSRMFSARPKVLQELLGLPLLWYIYRTATEISEQIWTVIGHGRDEIIARFPERQFIIQEQQFGTGHALQVAWDKIMAGFPDYLLICNGDTPLVSKNTLQNFINQSITTQNDLTFLSLKLPDPGNYGRVIRTQTGKIKAIVEAKDLQQYPTPSNEINSGIYFLRPQKIAPLLSQLNNNNAQQEFYITQLIELALHANLQVNGIYSNETSELLGINTTRELIEMEEFLRDKIVQGYINAGVRIHNHTQVRISPQSKIEADVDICGPCEIYGKSHIAAGTHISSHCFLQNVQLKACQVRSFSHIENSELAEGVTVGPFCRIRPGTILEQNVHIGNFVEVKKSHLRNGVKAGHLSYLGDSDIGAGVNIGAGTITCNYDGKNKHQTVIGEGAFIGSNSSLVAPVEIGQEAIIGAGTVVTKNVPKQNLCVARIKQKNLPHGNMLYNDETNELNAK